MIIAPESNGTLPERESKALENVRTEILIGEQKVKQLQAAERQLKGEIQADLNTKTLIASAIETLSLHRDDLNSKIAEAQEELTLLTNDVEEARKIFTDVSKKTDEKAAELDDREEQVTIREKQLKADIEEFDGEVEVFTEAKKRHNEKVTKLLNALK